VLYACDFKWWKEYHSEAVRVHHGEHWSISRPACSEYGLRYVDGARGEGLPSPPSTIRTGKNSGYQAIQLATLFGARRVVLLGYDFQRTRGREHWHPDHPARLGNGGRYEEWAAAMNALAPQLRCSGVEVSNSSRATMLRCFPRMPLDEAIHIYESADA
jgi:hypothetical protein